jgi:hypothetical protein
MEYPEGLEPTHREQELIQPRNIAERVLAHNLELGCGDCGRPFLNSLNRSVLGPRFHNAVHRLTPVQKDEDGPENT